MLELKSIIKDYPTGDTTVRALDDVTITFRQSEFVSVLGPSGCGKTTLLNIVGGLDSYTQGDLIIGGRSTREFRAYDWDAYRNNCVGFVFQSYNLIPHLTVLGNVELALTLSGESKQKRRERAIAALERVGLGEQLRKRPNQLSGGQMQRVAIARAIVNDPEIILADEPTGALDSHNSVQIAELLREISRDRLVVMVTHNDRLADEYSTRIIRLLDGKVVGDTHPYNPTQAEREEVIRADKESKGEPFHAEEYAPERYPDPTRPLEDEKKIRKAEKKAEKARLKNASAQERADAVAARKDAKAKQKAARAARMREMKRTSMGFTTALGLSGRNLSTKKGRTALVSFAGSIGIIGIALVLSISNGFTLYIDKLQTDTLAGFPITITPRAVDISSLAGSMGGNKVTYPSFPTDGKVQIYSQGISDLLYFNDISDEYLDYVRAIEQKDWANSVDYVNTVRMNVIARQETTAKDADGKVAETYKGFSVTSQSGGINGSSHWTELVASTDFIADQYTVEAGKFPTEAGDLALVVNKYNRINSSVLTDLGMQFERDEEGKISYDEILSKAASYKVIVNDNAYTAQDDVKDFSQLSPLKCAELYNAGGEEGAKNISLKIVGILRIKEGVPLELYGTGIVHTKALTNAVVAANMASQIVALQRDQFDTPYGAGIGFLQNKPFYEIAGLNEDSVKQWKGSEASIDAELMKTLGCDEEQANMLLYKAIADPELRFLDRINTDDALAFLCDKPQEVASLRSLLTADPISGMVHGLNTLYKMIENTKAAALESLGAAERPSSVYIYPKSFDGKKQINKYLDAYNDLHPDTKVMYTDASEILADTMGNMVDIISYVLIAFAAVSLVVSGIMIAIITYVSVIERTKEIGVLRSIGARKKDISRVFNAETMLIGAIAGIMGVGIAFLLNFPINVILQAVIEANGGGSLGIGNLAVLHPLHALVLVCISVVLTLFSGLIPSQIAAKKDPVTALRSE